MNIEQTVDLNRRAATHAALADVSRLRILDLLCVSDRSASEIGETLGVPSNLLAHHLRVLERAGLIVRRGSEGDRRRTYLSLRTDTVHDVAKPPASTIPAERVVFVCTANTARSHLAAALWRRASRIPVTSAGTHPGTEINPLAREAAERHGVSLPRIKPRRLDSPRLAGELLITVCDRAHEEIADQGWAHWSIPDPVVEGTAAAFDAAYELLSARVDGLAPQLVRAS
jgi:ArsR family transcriptional regulator, arsenate/arsenite/antimonite-responsive transcriptional repressor / arsenate reductase (thioredoxin)